MAAPIGNQFWKLRSKHGRDKLFSSPELLWGAACEYFEWCDNNPWMKKEPVKSGNFVGTIIDVPTQRPYSFTGFLLYIKASKNFWREFKAAGHKDFLEIIGVIEDVIETQQFEGAVVGAFNANIISRKLGLEDRQAISGPDGGAIPLSHNVENHRVIFENYKNE